MSGKGARSSRQYAARWLPYMPAIPFYLDWNIPALPQFSGFLCPLPQYIPGIEATVGVIDNYRNEETYALPPIEIRPKNKTFFDYEAKYGGATNEIVPGNFEYEDKLKLEDIAKKVHNVLGLRHYSRADFIVSPSRGIYVLEANTLPGLTEESLLPKALKAVGASMSHFFNHVLQLAIAGK